jgi:hypothetical protein
MELGSRMTERKPVDETNRELARRTRYDHCERITMWICAAICVVVIALRLFGVFK